MSDGLNEARRGTYFSDRNKKESIKMKPDNIFLRVSKWIQNLIKSYIK